MSVKSSYFKLSKSDFDNYLTTIKNQTSTMHFLDYTTNPYFFFETNEIGSLIIQLNKAECQFNLLINSFSSFTRNQIIQSFLLSEIDSTNKIENIYSTRHDIFSIMNHLKNDNHNLKIHSIVNAYQLLLQSRGSRIDALKDIKGIYENLLEGTLEKDDLPDGEYFRKGPVYITDGIKTIHTGISNEENINHAMEEFIAIYNSSINIYERMILSHFIIEKIHPYYDGNGRLGRFLFSNGIYFETNSLMSFIVSTSFAKDKSRYYKAFKDESDKYEFGCINVFVEETGKLLLENVKETMHELESKKNSIKDLIIPDDLSKTEIRIYSLIAEASLFSDFGISNEEILNETGVSKRSLIYAMNHFKELGILEDTKFGRLTYHKLNKLH